MFSESKAFFLIFFITPPKGLIFAGNFLSATGKHIPTPRTATRSPPTPPKKAFQPFSRQTRLMRVCPVRASLICHPPLSLIPPKKAFPTIYPPNAIRHLPPLGGVYPARKHTTFPPHTPRTAARSITAPHPTPPALPHTPKKAFQPFSCQTRLMRVCPVRASLICQSHLSAQFLTTARASLSFNIFSTDTLQPFIHQMPQGICPRLAGHTQPANIRFPHRHPLSAIIPVQNRPHIPRTQLHLPVIYHSLYSKIYVFPLPKYM